jgi:hypothetical protein
MPTYGWQSKKYPFGQYQAQVSGEVQQGTPARFLAVASYYCPDETTTDDLKIVANFGGTSELVLVNTATNVDLLNDEIDLTATPTLLPVNPANWHVSFRVEITTDARDPSPTSPEWPFVNNSDVTLFLYRNLLTQAIEIRTEPLDSNYTRGGIPRTNENPQYVPLTHVQTVFYFSNSPVKLRAATVISDKVGCVKTGLPAGQYDIEFYGAGILPSEYIQGYTIGAGDTLTPWKASSTTGIAQAAEFNAVKAEFSTLYWPGYVIAEDFSPERALLRDEDWKANAYGNNLAWQLFGRVFAGSTYVDFVGIAIDPPPE